VTPCDLEVSEIHVELVKIADEGVEELPGIRWGVIMQELNTHADAIRSPGEDPGVPGRCVAVSHDEKELVLPDR